MADDRLEQAVDIIARHVIARCHNRANWFEWYDDLIRGDDNVFETILDRVNDLAPWPDPVQYEAAYGYLTGRAEEAGS